MRALNASLYRSIHKVKSAHLTSYLFRSLYSVLVVGGLCFNQYDRNWHVCYLAHHLNTCTPISFGHDHLQMVCSQMQGCLRETGDVTSMPSKKRPPHFSKLTLVLIWRGNIMTWHTFFLFTFLLELVVLFGGLKPVQYLYFNWQLPYTC